MMPDDRGIVDPEIAMEARTRADQYKQALAYLNQCGDMTFEKYQDAHRISGAGMTEWEVRGMWEAAIDALAVTHDPDFARTNLRQTLEKSIGLFEKVAAAGKSPSPAAPPNPLPVSPKRVTERVDNFSFSCPNCSRRVSAPISGIGKTGKCPQCGRKCKIPDPKATAVSSQEHFHQVTPGGELSLVITTGGGYKTQIIGADDPATRVSLGVSFCELVTRDGNREAAEAVLTSLTCDSCGEVSIALATALADCAGPYAKAVRQLLVETYEKTGDSTLLGGMPLLRLAYVPALNRDLECLSQLAKMRDGDNGTELVHELVKFVEGGKGHGVYRVMAWGEGLDGAFRTAILEALPEHFSRKVALIAGLTDAVAYIKRHEDFR